MLKAQIYSIDTAKMFFERGDICKNNVRLLPNHHIRVIYDYWLASFIIFREEVGRGKSTIGMA